MNPHMRSEELEGIRESLKTAFDELGETIPLRGTQCRAAQKVPECGLVRATGER
jgi:hypothetical protein